MFGTRLHTRLALGAAAVLVAGAIGTAAVHAQQTPPAGGGQRPFGHRMMGPGGPGGPGMGGPGMGGPLGRLGFALRQLELTDAQREQVRTIMQGHQAEMKALGERLRTAHKGVDAAVTASPFDEGAIREASAGLASVIADGAVLRAKVRSEVWDVLTPEQRTKAEQLKATAQQRFEERVGRMKQRLEQRQQRRGQGGPVGDFF